MTTEPHIPWGDRDREAGGFHVVPQQLALAGNDLLDTAGTLDSVVSDVEDTRLGEDDLGILGKEADNAPGAYNEALDEYVAYFYRMQETLRAAGELLWDIARYYAAKDDSYYEQFNQITMR
jgi:hypothetical protein